MSTGTGRFEPTLDEIPAHLQALWQALFYLHVLNHPGDFNIRDRRTLIALHAATDDRERWAVMWQWVEQVNEEAERALTTLFTETGARLPDLPGDRASTDR